MKLIQVNIENLEEYWLKTREMIVSACKRSFGTYEAIDILGMLATNKMTMWVAEDESVKGLVIAEIVYFPRMKICRIVCCTGKKAKEWIHYLLDIEKWAKENGCKRMRPVCRKGWAKWLAEFGYQSGHIELEKAL